MGRAGVYGRGIKFIDSTTSLLGINIGYNFYTEHEQGTEELIECINTHRQIPNLTLSEWHSPKGIKEQLKLKRADNKALRLKERWKNCPYYEYMISANVNMFRREIIIDNSAPDYPYQNRLLANGNYTYMEIGYNFSPDSWKKKFGARRKFKESELIYAQDYNNSSIINRTNPGLFYHALKYGEVPSIHQDIPVSGTWMSGGNYISLFINNDSLKGADVANQLENIIRSGNLAVVPEQEKLFSDRGCILMNLDAMYFTDKYR